MTAESNILGFVIDNDDPLADIALNDNQRRHYEVLMTRLEDSLARIESLLSAPRPHRLTLVDDDVSPAFRAHAKAEIPRIQRQIERVSEALHLQPRAVSLRRMIGASLTTDAIRIEDSLASQMRGYGTVDPSIAERLDPALMRLAGSLQALSAMLKR
jgi:hypothetical protein